MKRLAFLVLLFISLWSCQNDFNTSVGPDELIPRNSLSVFKINELNDFNSSIENHPILSRIYIKELKDASVNLKQLQTTKPVYLSFVPSNTDSLYYLILTKQDSTLFEIDSIPNRVSELYLDSNIHKTQIDSTLIYHKVIGKTFASSNNLQILKNLEPTRADNSFRSLLQTSNTKSIASVVFRSDSTNYSRLLLAETKRDSTNQNDIFVFDLHYSDKDLNYNGLIRFEDSISNPLHSFKQTIPQKINALRLAPNTTESLMSLTFNDYSIFKRNLSEINTKATDSTSYFLNFITEISLIDDLVVCHSLDANLTLEAIEDKTLSETFRDIDFYEFEMPELFKSQFMPFFTYDSAKFLAQYKDFILFSRSLETLKSTLVKALNNNTLANSEAVKTLHENLSDEASLYLFKNSEALSNVMQTKLKGYNANAIQYIYEGSYAHVNGVIQTYKKKGAANSVEEAFTITLDSDMLSAPQTVKNHITNAHDIAVQDVNNNLYLISDSGNILWKKKLQGKILGQIEQVDIYKNGRLQLVFATPNRIYALDRNGNAVSNFPLKFKSEITQPLSVFDYDNNHNYRLLVVQGKTVLMYNKTGKVVSGFDYSNNGSAITSQPKHFRIDSKDYITFQAGTTLKILNRRGRVRINVKENIRFSENEVYLYKNQFTTSNTAGQLIQVNTKGQLSKTQLELTEPHHITATSKTLVSLSENKLTIKSRTVDLDYGDYTAPEIFYINDKIYVTTTDLQSKKVYLFDSQGKSIPNFPVFGVSGGQLQRLDKSRGLELITQSDAKTISVYKMQ